MGLTNIKPIREVCYINNDRPEEDIQKIIGKIKRKSYNKARKLGCVITKETEMFDGIPSWVDRPICCKCASNIAEAIDESWMYGSTIFRYQLILR